MEAERRGRLAPDARVQAPTLHAAAMIIPFLLVLGFVFAVIAAVALLAL